MTVTAVCPGSFDPITNGHLDVVERVAPRFDEVVVAVLENPRKASGLFTVDERIELIERVVDHLPRNGIGTIVKGLRAVSDFEYELQMAQMNQRLAQVETLFLSTSPDWSYLSSSLVKEVASYGGDITGLVPESVRHALLERV